MEPRVEGSSMFAEKLLKCDYSSIADHVIPPPVPRMRATISSREVSTPYDFQGDKVLLYDELPKCDYSPITFPVIHPPVLRMGPTIPPSEMTAPYDFQGNRVFYDELLKCDYSSITDPVIHPPVPRVRATLSSNEISAPYDFQGNGVFYDVNKEYDGDHSSSDSDYFSDSNVTGKVVVPDVSLKTRQFDGFSTSAENSDFYDYDSVIRRPREILPTYPVHRIQTFRSSGFIDAYCDIDAILKEHSFARSFPEFIDHYKDEFPPCYKGCIAAISNPLLFDEPSDWAKHFRAENVWISLGCHPKYAKFYTIDIERSLCKTLGHSKVKALGDIGLDYTNDNYSYKDIQIQVFKRQLQVAVVTDLPVIISSKVAHEDCLTSMLEILPENHKILLHAFDSSWYWVDKFLRAFPNLSVSLTNIVTYPDAEVTHEVARNIPLSRLLVASNSPSIVPKMISDDKSHSHPGMAIHVVAQVAALKKIPLRHVLRSVFENTVRTYNLS